METVALIITTFNSESYFQDLYRTIPFGKIDEVIVVNGGKDYKEEYENVKWIQHRQVKYPSVARNDGLKYAIEKEFDHIFLIEDDMIIKSHDIFDQYIDASKKTGIEYFIYASIAWNSGQKGNRTPKLQVQYSPDLSLNFYDNMCNEFTYRSKKIAKDVGLYDENLRYLFDVDYTYRVSQTLKGVPFWCFPDLANSDDLIDNNPNAVSRLDGDGKRITRLGPDYDYFEKKHGLKVQQIPQTNKDHFIDKIKLIKPQ
jgi:hypothetical protein